MKIIISESAYEWLITVLESSKKELPLDFQNRTWSLRYNEAVKHNDKVDKNIANFKKYKKEFDKKRNKRNV